MVISFKIYWLFYLIIGMIIILCSFIFGLCFCLKMFNDIFVNFNNIFVMWIVIGEFDVGDLNFGFFLYVEGVFKVLVLY